MKDVRYRPIVQAPGDLSPSARQLAGGSLRFEHLERVDATGCRETIPVDAAPPALVQRLSDPRPDICGLSMMRPRIMGIVNVTPDSFSDGGKFDDPERAVEHALRLVEQGADILDIGGESTRPGADTVPEAEECARIVPVIKKLHALGVSTPISIDTRKAGVAAAAIEAGAVMVNDVSALRFDPDLAGIVAQNGLPVCLMHSQGQPKTMQDAPGYDDVIAEVFDDLSQRIDVAVAAGIARSAILIDPGIGFGKTLDHNLSLIRNISTFHGLGCPLLLGMSRKRMIDAIAHAPDPRDRVGGSVALALEAVRQGVQIVRVHDVAETRQALDMWIAVANLDD